MARANGKTRRPITSASTRAVVAILTERGVSSFGLALVDSFFPKRCAICFRECELAKENVAACFRCAPLILPPAVRCLRCSAALPAAGGFQERCLLCRDKQWSFQQAYCLASYHGRLKSAIVASKKFTLESVAFALGNELGRWLSSMNLPKYDCLVPVPQHWTRRIIRRTNNSETIAEGITQYLPIPICKAIVRTRVTEKQGILSTTDRRNNVLGAFKARNYRNLAGKAVLVVDDVVTSGATVSEVAKVLKKAGVKRVDVAAVARGVGEGVGKEA